MGLLALRSQQTLLGPCAAGRLLKQASTQTYMSSINEEDQGVPDPEAWRQTVFFEVEDNDEADFVFDSTGCTGLAAVFTVGSGN